jgi:hypothetical protein
MKYTRPQPSVIHYCGHHHKVENCTLFCAYALFAEILWHKATCEISGSKLRRTLSQELKQQGREAARSPPNSSEVKETWIYTPLPHTPSW